MAEDLTEGHAAQPEEGAPLVATSAPVPSKGWHADPFERHRFRHWDGQAWTAYVSDGRTTSWDSVPLAEPVDRPVGMPGIGTAVVGFVVGVALSFAVQRVVHLSRPSELLVSSLALWSGLIGAVVLVSVRRGTGSLVRDVGLRFRWIDLAYGLAGSIAGRMLSNAAASPIPLPHRKLGQTDRPLGVDGRTTATWIVLVLVVCIGAPLVEEIFFRGLVQSRLVTRHGTAVGIGVASLLFGAAHLISWDGPFTLAYAWAVAAGGVVLGVTYYLTGRLGTSIVAHACFNAQALLAIALLT